MTRKVRVKKKKNIKEWIRRVLLVFCGAILGLNIYLVNANSLIGNQLPMPFGYGIAIVLSGSMEPELSVGDLIVVKEVLHFQENDIVVYQDDRILVVHRIMDMQGNTIITQGDANNVTDAPITVDMVKGKVIWHSAILGRIVHFLKSPVGIVCILVAAFILMEIPRRREMQKDEAQRQKIIEEIKHLKENEF